MKMDATSMDGNLKYHLTKHLTNIEDESPIASVNEQYLVMQNDNDTTTLSQQPVEFITQVPAANGIHNQSKTAFSPQQEYYVHDSAAFELSDCLVPNNTEEIVSGDENYFIQSAAESSHLQSQETVITNENVQKLEMDVCDNGVTDNLEMLNATTEITLNQEQWQMMEQNGWVLLEFNSKIYLLDTLGLHDISDNADLIQNLKNEYAFSTSQEVEKAENTNHDISFNDHAEATETLIAPEKSSCNNNDLKRELNDLDEVNVAEDVATPVQPKQKTIITNKAGTMTFKTNIEAEKIPNKLLLGTTIHGKKLVAKIVKKPKTIKKSRNTNIPTAKAIYTDESTGNTDTEKVKVDQFFKNFLRNMLTPPKLEDIQKAESLINQLLQIQTTKARLIGHNILVTKNIQASAESSDPETPTQPTYVSGSVISAGLDRWCFKYETQLLQRIMTQKLNAGISDQKDAIVHVHIEETRQAEGSLIKTSITINKQNIRLLPIHRKLVHACTDCANLFETEEDLQEHRKKPCIEQKTNPEIIYSKEILDYFTPKTKDGIITKSFLCTHCNATVRQRDLKRHATSHMGPNLGGKQTDGEQDLHQCTMCPIVFYHRSTLSKHFMNCHIKKNAQYTYQN